MLTVASPTALCSTKTRLYLWNPVCLKRTPSSDIHKEPLRLIAMLLILLRPNSEVKYDTFSEDGQFNVVSRGDEVRCFKWVGQPELPDHKMALFGSLTSVWQGFALEFAEELQRVILKAYFQRRKRAFHEGDILARLNRDQVIGVQQLTFHGIACSDDDDAVVVKNGSKKDTGGDDIVRVLVLSVSVLADDLFHADLPLLLCAMRDAARIIWDAWNKSGVRHHDISIGNIRLARGPPPSGEQKAAVESNRLILPELKSNPTALRSTVIDFGNAALNHESSGSDHLRYVEKAQWSITHARADACRFGISGHSGTLPFLSRDMLQAIMVRAQIDEAIIAKRKIDQRIDSSVASDKAALNA